MDGEKVMWVASEDHSLHHRFEPKAVFHTEAEAEYWVDEQPRDYAIYSVIKR